MIRAFVGIAVPPDICAMLSGAQAGLTVGHRVPMENFHITLAFLGEHPEPVLGELHDLLEAIRVEPMRLEVQGLGVFGGESPRLLFAEVVPHPALSDLRKQVVRAARDAGIALKHERYHPHITLARLGKGLLPDEAAILQEHISRRMARTVGTIPVTGFVLYESRLGRNGPAYEVLAEYPG